MSALLSTRPPRGSRPSAGFDRARPAAARLRRPLGLSAAAILIGLTTAGCATTQRWVEALPALEEHHTEIGTIVIKAGPGDAVELPRLQRSLAYAAPRLARWGTLRHPIEIRVLPDHATLEKVTGHHDHAWMHAWARYREIDLQAPRTWGSSGASQSALDRLLLHELTHVMMFQRTGAPSDWHRREIPLWFREGMASFTARQAYRWPSLEDLARVLTKDRADDPLRDARRLYREQSELVYGMAHHAFVFLLNEGGDARIDALLDRMANGERFPEAFTAVYGEGEDAFLDRFRRHVRKRRFLAPREAD